MLKDIQNNRAQIKVQRLYDHTIHVVDALSGKGSD